MTDGTAFEDLGEELPERGRPKSQDTLTDSKYISGTKDNKGNVVIAYGVAQGQTDIALESMNYLVEGVLGQL